MFNYGYTCYQAERAKTQAEQREADAQLGQLLAAFAQLLGSLAKPVRALRPSQEQSRRRASMRATRQRELSARTGTSIVTMAGGPVTAEPGTAAAGSGVSGPQRRPLAVG